jgi:hypothetical protein
VRRDDAGGSLVEGAQDQRGLIGAHPHDHRHPVDVGQRDVAPQVGDLVRSVLTVDHHEVEAADRQHLDQVLGRQPEQRAQQPLARAQTRFQGVHDTLLLGDLDIRMRQS